MRRTTETTFLGQKACRGASGVESSLLQKATATTAPHAITTSAMMIGARVRGLSPGGGKLDPAFLACGAAARGLGSGTLVDDGAPPGLPT